MIISPQIEKESNFYNQDPEFYTSVRGAKSSSEGRADLSSLDGTTFNTFTALRPELFGGQRTSGSGRAGGWLEDTRDKLLSD